MAEYSERNGLNVMPVYNGALVRKMSSRNGKMFPGLMTDIMKVYQGTIGMPNRRGKMCSPEGVYFAQMLGAICQAELANGHVINKDTFVNLFVLHGVNDTEAAKRMDDMQVASADIAKRSGYAHLQDRDFFQDYGAFLAQGYKGIGTLIDFRNEDGTMRSADAWTSEAKHLIEVSREREAGELSHFFEYQNMLHTAESSEVTSEEPKGTDASVQKKTDISAAESKGEAGIERGIANEAKTSPDLKDHDEQYAQLRSDASARGALLPALDKLKGSKAYQSIKDCMEQNKQNRIEAKEYRLSKEPGALSKYLTIMANGVLRNKGKFAVGMLLATGGNLPAAALALGAAKYISSKAMRKERLVMIHKDQAVIQALKSAIGDLGWSAEEADAVLSAFAGDANREHRTELLQKLSKAALEQTAVKMQSPHLSSMDLHGAEQRGAYEDMLINGGGYPQDRVDEMLSHFDGLKGDDARHGFITQEYRYQQENQKICEQNVYARIDEVRDAIVKKYGAHPDLCVQQLLALGCGQVKRFDGRLADPDKNTDSEENRLAAASFVETRYEELGLSGREPSMRERYMDNLQNVRMDYPLQVSDKLAVFDGASEAEQEKLFAGSLKDMPDKNALSFRFAQRRTETLHRIYERFGPGQETAARMEEYMRTKRCAYDMDKDVTFTYDAMSAATQKKATDRLASVERSYLSSLQKPARETVHNFSTAAAPVVADVPDCTNGEREVGGIPDVTGDGYNTPKHRVQTATSALQDGDPKDDAAYPNMSQQLEGSTDTDSNSVSVPIIEEVAPGGNMESGLGA